MPCRTRKCAGCLAITRSGERIEWQCSLCEQAGVINGWEGTRWNLFEVEIGPDGDDVTANFRLDELAALRKLHGIPPTLRAALALTRLIEDRACTVLTIAETKLLLEAIEKQGPRKQVLQRAYGRLDQVLTTDRLHPVPRDAAVH